MIQLDNVAQKAIYYVSPYFSHINLTGAYIKEVDWDKDHKEGVLYAVKNNETYKIGLFPKLYRGSNDEIKRTSEDVHSTARKITADLTKVGSKEFKMGYIYNLRYFN